MYKALEGWTRCMGRVLGGIVKDLFVSFIEREKEAITVEMSHRIKNGIYIYLTHTVTQECLA